MHPQGQSSRVNFDGSISSTGGSSIMEDTEHENTRETGGVDGSVPIQSSEVEAANRHQNVGSNLEKNSDQNRVGDEPQEKMGAQVEKAEEDSEKQQNSPTISSKKNDGIAELQPSSFSGSKDLSQLEQDTLSKSRARASGSGTTRPGGVSVSEGGDALNRLENDVVARSGTSSSGVAADCEVENPLTQAEKDVLAKSGRRPHDSSSTSPGATDVNGVGSSLDVLESDVLAKYGNRSSGASPVRPGVVSVGSSGNTSKSPGKSSTRQRAPAVPGAHAVNGASSLNVLESDVMRKSRTRSPKRSTQSARYSLGEKDDVPIPLPGQAGSDEPACPGAHASSVSAASQMERDLMRKNKERSPPRSSHSARYSLGEQDDVPTSLPRRDDNEEPARPGAHACRISALSQMERDLMRKNKERRPPDLARLDGDASSPTSLPPHAVSSSMPGAHSITGSSSLSQLERDVTRKNRTQSQKRDSNLDTSQPRHASSASIPGAHSVPGSSSLSQLERDVMKKNRTRNPRPDVNAEPRGEAVPNFLPGCAVGAQVPGARAVSGSSSLSELERDVMRKNRTRPPETKPGSQLEQDVVTTSLSRRAVTSPGARPVNGTSSLSELEQDVLTKSTAGRSRNMTGSSYPSSSGQSSLAQLEEDALAKSRARPTSSTTVSSSLSRLEEGILAKSRAQSSRGASLDQLEEDIASKIHVRRQRSGPGDPGASEDNFHSSQASHTRSTVDEDRSDDRQNNWIPGTIIDGVVVAPAGFDGGLNRLRSDEEEAMDQSYEYEERSHELIAGDQLDDDSFASRGGNADPTTVRIENPDSNGPNGDLVFMAEAVPTATSAIVVSEDEEKELERQRVRKFVRLGGIVLVLVVAIVIAVAVVVSGHGGGVDAFEALPTNAPSFQPSSAPSFAPTTEKLVELFNALRAVYEDDVYFDEIFTDLGSPQYEAALWIANDDDFPMASFADPKIVQRFALTTFYFATNGDSWIKCNRFDTVCRGNFDESSWLARQDECHWDSVRCTSDGTVDRIFFNTQDVTAFDSPYELSGSLPRELVLLTDLGTIILEKNKIGGSIPSSWSGMSNLETLRLGNNMLTGSIPDGLLSNNPLLGTIHLDNNRLAGKLPSIPPSTQVVSLRLQNNAFQGMIQSEIGQATSLQELDIESNYLAGQIPTELYGLSNLRRLLIGGNAELYGSLDPEIVNFKPLTELSLGGTQLNGTLPTALFNLTELVALNISAAAFSGTLPEAFSNLESLMFLSLNNNRFTGSVPVAFESLTNLNLLQIHGNELIGTISQAICDRRGILDSQLRNLTADCKVVNGASARVVCTCCTGCF